eukprot:SAG22_NODE_366_length_11615_cov_13.379125_8_plen_146_part_00
MEIFQIKTLRKAIRQNNFDKKVFLGFVQDYTNSIYNQKPRSQNNIDEAIQLILVKGFAADGGVDMKAANQITDIAPLSALTSLDELYFDDNPWTGQPFGRSNWDTMCLLRSRGCRVHTNHVRALSEREQRELREKKEKAKARDTP